MGSGGRGERERKMRSRIEGGVSACRDGEEGGVDDTVDSEELRLVLSDSTPFSFSPEEVVSGILRAIDAVRFLAGSRGISFPGNSSRN